MTSEPPYSDNGGSAENGGSGGSRGGRAAAGIAPVRAVVVLIVFLVASIALVGVGTRGTPSGSADIVTTTTTTTTTPGKTTPSTTTTTVPHSSVTVVVANATTTSGLAAHYTSVLAAQGWAMQTAADATTNEATSTVYYQAGQQASAELVASELGLKPAAVQPYTAAVPVPGTTTVDVVVVIGADLAAGAGT
jgi:LytR cell envelope-related transcriptional attenuator